MYHFLFQNIFWLFFFFFLSVQPTSGPHAVRRFALEKSSRCLAGNQSCITLAVLCQWLGSRSHTDQSVNHFKAEKRPHVALTTAKGKRDRCIQQLRFFNIEDLCLCSLIFPSVNEGAGSDSVQISSSSGLTRNIRLSSLLTPQKNGRDVSTVANLVYVANLFFLNIQSHR